jgi:hypothetical protein
MIRPCVATEWLLLPRNPPSGGFERGNLVTGMKFIFLLFVVIDKVIIGTIFAILFYGLLEIKFPIIF